MQQDLDTGTEFLGVDARTRRAHDLTEIVRRRHCCVIEVRGRRRRRTDALFDLCAGTREPSQVIDEIGLDITVDIAATLEKSLGARGSTPAILQKMQEAKMFGRKTGSGFYKYEGKQQSPNEAIEKWRGPVAGDAFPSRSAPLPNPVPGTASLATDDLALRLVYLMVNEAARCLEEKVVAAPEDADYGMILGTGFAPLRGGPLRFSDHVGAAEMVRLGEKLGGKFQPCDLLRKHAENGTKFYEK